MSLHFRLVFSILIFLLAIYSPGMSEERSNNVTEANNNLQLATFAGGCFWCMEPPFDKLEGVVATVSGYCGGHKKDPTYQEVTTGSTGHTEALQVTYDASIVSYEELLDVFWKNINPVDADGQFVDRGSQYRPGIFYHNEEQKRLAEFSRNTLEESRRFKAPIKTEITALDVFYPAEEYHQNYYQKSPLRYQLYRYNSGRDQFINKIWGDNNK